jgi:misacylated tRNA(Ala) deacylase
MKENIDPKMHTAEHILNQTMIRLFGTGRCFCAHIEKKKSKCDYHFERPLTVDDIKKIENKINEIIGQGVPVTKEIWTNERVKKELDYKTELKDKEVSIIKVGDYDAIPCIGAHVSSTKDIGEFKIISTDFEDGVLRIRYRLN